MAGHLSKKEKKDLYTPYLSHFPNSLLTLIGAVLAFLLAKLQNKITFGPTGTNIAINNLPSVSTVFVSPSNLL